MNKCIYLTIYLGSRVIENFIQFYSIKESLVLCSTV